MLTEKYIENILRKNFEYIRKKKYLGYDPLYFYKFYFSELYFKKPNIILKILKYIEKRIVLSSEIFFYKYVKVLGCKESVSPYGLGVLIQAYLKMYISLDDKIFLLEAIEIEEKMRKLLIKTKNGIGVGNPKICNKIYFGKILDNDKAIYLPGTAEVFLGYYELYKLTNKKKYFEIIEQIINSMAKDFKIKNIDENKSCFDYSNQNDNYHILNANALLGECFIKFYELTKKESYKILAEKIFNYIYPYFFESKIPYAGIEDEKINSNWKSYDVYHTGFTLRGMYSLAIGLEKNTDFIIDKVEEMLDDFIFKGKIMYLKNNKLVFGRDSHGIAEYINIYALFFRKLSSKKKLEKMEIIEKELKNIITSEKETYYYYTKRKKLKIFMPRWSHAPMMNALVTLYLKVLKEKIC